MVHGVDTAAQRVFLQQPAKTLNEDSSSAIKDTQAADKSSSLTEAVKNGNYKLDTEATAKSLALYLLNKE